jgi:hypothetical protein
MIGAIGATLFLVCLALFMYLLMDTIFYYMGRKRAR